MNEHSSRKAFSIRIEVVWRKFDIASKYRSDNLPKYSEDEELAAEMIIYLVAYLKRFGCEDIEQLIKDKIEFDDRKNDQVLLLTVCVVDFVLLILIQLVMTEIIQVCLLDFNKGQLTGLPKNPRFFRDYRFEAMKKSIQDSPEMLELRELIVFPYNDGRYIVVCGNLRLRACKELGYKELPCKILAPDTPVKKLREYATKDNVNFGENDLDVMENQWNKSELQDWGIEFAPEKKEDEFKERFDAITDDTAIYPLIPKYDEKHELFIITSSNEVDSNWLR